MATSGSFSFPTRDSCFSGVLEIKSPADRFIKHFIRVHNNVSVGELRFTVNEINGKKRAVIVHIIGDVISEYKMVKATLTTIPMRALTPSIVAWSVVFEKNCLNIQDPEQIIGPLKNLIDKIDRNLYQQDNTMNSMYVESPAVECFKAISEAFKVDADVEIEAQDWDNMTTTLSLKRTHVFMTNFKMIKVTITVTPHHEEDDGSLLQWILEIDNGGITSLEIPDIGEMIKDELRK